MAKRKNSILDEIEDKPRKRFADKLSGNALRDWNDLAEALKQGKLANISAACRVFKERNPDVSISESYFYKVLTCAAK